MVRFANNSHFKPSLAQFLIFPQDPTDADLGPVSSSRQVNLAKIKSHAISVLRQYEKEHAKKLEDLIGGLMHQLNLLYEG